VYLYTKKFLAVRQETSFFQKLPFEDGCNINYANGAYRGNDALGKLMHDFCTPNADEMNYSELAKRFAIISKKKKE